MKKILILFSIMLLLVACTKEEENIQDENLTVEGATNKKDTPQQKENDQETKNQADIKQNDSTSNNDETAQVEVVQQVLQSNQDEDLQSQLLKEKHVNNAVVNVMDELDILIISVEVDEKMIKEDANQLAKRYTELAKKQYKEFSIHMMINQSDQELTRYSID